LYCENMFENTHTNVTNRPAKYFQKSLMGSAHAFVRACVRAGVLFP